MRIPFALIAVSARALTGCDLNPPAPQKAAQVTCNCTQPPPAVTPPPAPPEVTPEPKPVQHATRHHVRRYARHRRSHYDDYAYDYHGGSTYTPPMDHPRRPHD